MVRIKIPAIFISRALYIELGPLQYITQDKSVSIVFILILCGWLIYPDQALAQDIEPRRWTSLPLGANVIGVGYGNTSGDVFFNPVLNVEDTEVKVHTLVTSYVRSFSLAGKLARLDALIPWQSASWNGLLDGELASAERDGFADPRIRLSVNLIGAPALGTEQLRDYFVNRPVNTAVGAALAVSVPAGEYFDDRLLNLGQNRFTFRPQLGVVHTRGYWSYELTGSMFLFTDNNNFFNGKKREQKPLYAIQTHVIRLFKPGLWISLSTSYGSGGRSRINGESKDDERENLLAAFSIGLPVTRNQGVKFTYIRARTLNNIGSDTDTLALGWSILF